MANAYYKSITVSHQGEYSERMRWSRVKQSVLIVNKIICVVIVRILHKLSKDSYLPSMTDNIKTFN